MPQNEKLAAKSYSQDLLLHSFTTYDRIKKWDESDNPRSVENPYTIKVGDVPRTINLCLALPVKFDCEI